MIYLKKFDITTYSRLLITLYMRIKRTVIQELTNLAKKSDVRSQHAAAILNNKGEIIVSATNYHLHKPYHGKIWKPEGEYTVHAEEAAYIKFIQKYHHLIKGGKSFILIVIRIQRGGTNCLHSKPCKKCTQKINKLIKKKVISKVYYSVPT